MLSETLSEGLENYRIGVKIRHLRKLKDMGLAQLGDHTGLSAGMLSKIERGQVVPTLPTLLRIALVFGVGLDHFFSPEEEQPLLCVVRKRDRLRLPDKRDGRASYFFESLDYPVTDKAVETFSPEFPASGVVSEPHSHSGHETLIVTEGQIELHIHGKTILLATGDTVTFDAGFEHAYSVAGKARARALIVINSIGQRNLA